MKCPRCGNDDDKVVDSRAIRDGMAVRRRRECLSCSERFTTYEYVETGPQRVIKRDGQREAFDRSKIVSGIARACEKRPVALEEIDRVVEEIERQLTSSSAREVSTQDIGKLVMESLRDLDEVAYVRFASVYRSFKSVDEFMQELRGILSEKDERS